MRANPNLPPLPVPDHLLSGDQKERQSPQRALKGLFLAALGFVVALGVGYLIGNHFTSDISW